MESTVVEEKNIPDVVEIEIPPTTKEDKPKREYKKREKKTTAPKQKSAIGTQEINSLVCGMFSLVAMKGGEHWAVTPDEANTISVPLNNIFEKMDISEQVAKFSDGVMLLIAIASITIPRILISNSTSKKSKEEKIKSELEVKSVDKTTGNNNQVRKENNNGSSQGSTLLSKSDNALSYASPQ